MISVSNHFIDQVLVDGSYSSYIAVSCGIASRGDLVDTKDLVGL